VSGWIGRAFACELHVDTPAGRLLRRCLDAIDRLKYRHWPDTEIADEIILAMPPEVAEVYLTEDALPLHSCADCGFRVPLTPDTNRRPARRHFDSCPLCGGKVATTPTSTAARQKSRAAVKIQAYLRRCAMRAVTFSRFGGPEVLEVMDLPEPQPGPGQVRIHVAAATVNPTDIGFRSGRQSAQLNDLQPPYIPGMELAGTVDAVGSDTNWSIGDRVMAIVIPRRPEGGAMAESVIVPSNSVARVPEGSSLEEAATLPMNGLTVRRALDLLGLKPGETLAVTGAAGAVGGYGVELGVAAGLRVIAVAGPADEALLTKLGAESVIPRGDDVAGRIRELVPGGVDGLLDAAVIGAPILPAVRDGGGMAVVRGFEGDTERGIAIHQVRVSDYAENHEALDGLGQLVSHGKLTLRVAEAFPPERVGEAQSRLEAGGVRGRLIIVF